MKEGAVDLTKILKPYPDKWVALTLDRKRVVGSGNTPKQATESASKAGVKKHILTKVPKDSASYIL